MSWCMVLCMSKTWGGWDVRIFDVNSVVPYIMIPNAALKVTNFKVWNPGCLWVVDFGESILQELVNGVVWVWLQNYKFLQFKLIFT